MKNLWSLILICVATLVGCGGSGSPSAEIPQAQTAAQGGGEDSGRDSLFGGYLTAMDKARDAQQGANARQQQMDAMVGAETTAEPRHTLGMVDIGESMAEVAESNDGSMFGDMVTSMNKAKATAGMLNQRQAQMNQMWGVKSQSTQATGNNPAASEEEALAETERPGAESTDSASPPGSVKAVQRALNQRNEELESMWGITSQSSRP